MKDCKKRKQELLDDEEIEAYVEAGETSYEPPAKKIKLSETKQEDAVVEVEKKTQVVENLKESQDDGENANEKAKATLISLRDSFIQKIDGNPTESEKEVAAKEIASRIMNDMRLKIGDVVAQFFEIEFYFTVNSLEGEIHKNNHFDPFTHCYDEQFEIGTFYFHKHGKAYRSGNYKGMDVTFGINNGKHKIFGGFLIRSLLLPKTTSSTNPKSKKSSSSSSQQLIEGPCLVVDHILSTLNVKSIEELVKTKKDKMEVIQNQENSSKKQTIHAGTRVGLSMKRTDFLEERVRYISAPYRFSFDPKQIKKQRFSFILPKIVENVWNENENSSNKKMLSNSLVPKEVFGITPKVFNEFIKQARVFKEKLQKWLKDKKDKKEESADTSKITKIDAQSHWSKEISKQFSEMDKKSSSKETTDMLMFSRMMHLFCDHKQNFEE